MAETEENRPDPEEPGENVTEQAKYKPLRLWPAVLFLVGLVTCRFLSHLIDEVSPVYIMISIFGPIVFGVLILIWWMFFSRATKKERFIGGLCTIAIALLSFGILDESMMGPGMMMISIPLGLGLFGLGAILFSGLRSFHRTGMIVLLSTLGFVYPTLLRNEGMWGHFELGLHWRWTPTNEAGLLSEKEEDSQSELFQKMSPEFDSYLAEPAWPEFRGKNRDGELAGIELAAEWGEQVQTPLWKIPVGPGWSSFVVAGNLLFTQEQRGKNELVVCYDAETGGEIWNRNLAESFSDPLGGPGPRATPTLANGFLYVMGARGDLLKIDPKTTEVLWRKDLKKVADCEPPIWGFSSSPLVVDSVVIVHAGGKEDKGILAFDTESGELKWSVASGNHTYSSPHLIEMDGEKAAAMLTNKELYLLNPSDGAVLLKYDCESEGHRVVQPQLIAGDTVLITDSMGEGASRLQLSIKDGKWSASELWKSKDLKPDFNDFVIHEGYVYGFDNTIFTCIDLETGKRKWKRGRYGKGQVLLLTEAGQLLVISETGDLVLLKANPDKHEELASFHALDGKTWNHPVLIGDRLYLRNSQEAAAYRLPLVRQVTSK